MSVDAERLWRTAGATAAAVGLTAAVAPNVPARAVGLPVREMTGTATLGWRLFGIRTAVIGAAALHGHRHARPTILPVQVPDQLAMVAALRAATVPGRAVAVAMTAT